MESSLLSSILRNTQFGESYIEELSHKNNVPQNIFFFFLANLESCGLFSEFFLKQIGARLLVNQLLTKYL